MLDDLRLKIKTLNELMWEGRLPWTDVEKWLSNFSETTHHTRDEQELHSLYLLSHFSYFNATLVRQLLKALFRDLVLYPIVERLRPLHGNPSQWTALEPHVNTAVSRLRFLGPGAPAASGAHLLYYFRQENDLPTTLFPHPHELFARDQNGSVILAPNIDHVIFIDDFCGSGVQVSGDTRELLMQLTRVAPTVRRTYLPLFATHQGLTTARGLTLFTEITTLCELDGTFRSLDPSSRYFRDADAPLDRNTARSICAHYGAQIEPQHPLGFSNNQLLLGFAHNIPDNTLPIFWSTGRSSRAWIPAFRRHVKKVGA